MADKLDQEELIPTRATLINRLRNWQDQASWQDFFNTYWSLIYGLAVKSGLNKSEAQDVVQETMISVARNMHAFQYDPAQGSFKSWLLNVARWRITDQFRKRSPDADQHNGTEPTTLCAKMFREGDRQSSDLEKVWDEEWERNLMEAALTKTRRQMDPKQYQIFDFCVNKGWPAEKVAKTFGVSASLVYSTRQRVTEAIKTEVQRLQKDII